MSCFAATAAGERVFADVELDTPDARGDYPDLSGANFANCSLESAAFAGANVEGANFAGAFCYGHTIADNREWAAFFPVEMP